MGSQRITSKVSNSGIFTASPVKDTLQAKYATLTTKIKERFDTLGVTYNGVAKTGGLLSTPPSGGWGAGVYFYHSDHLGSSSLITDGTGALVQHIEYVPFGEVFLDERNSTWSTPYLFNAKERDEETGLYYYHARYYDSKRSVWLSVDPLGEEKPFISSYVYCRNNPINMVDPDGMDEFEVAHDGRTVKVADNTNKDIVYSLNKNGDRISSCEFDYNTIKLSSAKEGKDNYYFMQVKGDENAQKLFEFVATPQNFGLKAGKNVEWSIFYTGKAGDNGVNFLATSQGLDSEKAGSYLFNNQLKNGYTIRGHDHNHPTNEPTPSGTGGVGGDIQVMKKWKKQGNFSPNSQFRIFTPGLSKKYHTYNENTVAQLPEFTISAKKKTK